MMEDNNREKQHIEQDQHNQYRVQHRYGSHFGPQGKQHYSNRHSHQEIDQNRRDHEQHYHRQPAEQHGNPGQQFNQQSNDHQPYLQNHHRQQHYDQQHHQYGQQHPQPTETTIKNPQANIVPPIKGPAMNNRDLLNDILASEKYLTDGFNVFVRETSHRELYQDIRQILLETHDCARELFNLMFKDGFYSFQAAQAQDIEQVKQKYSQYINYQDPYSQNQGW